MPTIEGDVQLRRKGNCVVCGTWLWAGYPGAPDTCDPCLAGKKRAEELEADDNVTYKHDEQAQKVVARKRK